MPPSSSSVPRPVTTTPKARGFAGRSAAAGLFAAGLLLSACDGGVTADSYTLSLSEDGRHVVVEQEWTLPLGSEKGDITFNRADVAPGGVVASTLSGEEHVVLLTSTYDDRAGSHRVDLEIDGFAVNRAELFFQGFDDRQQLAAAAENVVDLPEPEVMAAPRSYHYDYVSDDNGNQVLIVTYDYAGGGSFGRVGDSPSGAERPGTRASAPRAGEEGRADLLPRPGEPLAMEVEHVGYRLVLDEPVPAWSRLRVAGYDALEIDRAAFAYGGGRPAPASALRRSVPASEVRASLLPIR